METLILQELYESHNRIYNKISTEIYRFIYYMNSCDCNMFCRLFYLFIFFQKKKKKKNERKILLALSCNLFKWLDHVFMFYELNSVRNTNNFFLVGKKIMNIIFRGVNIYFFAF